ncbi:MAG: metallophosphoesterase [Peptococcaceae bacterium]|jgi:predicted MPP superfamily phosphohydrolase|nr:metallophosphoesterase [Peptococcaceae bacterium]
MFYLMVLVALVLYGGLNYYVGLRGWQILVGFLPLLNSKVYWVLFWLIAFSYIIGQLSGSFLPETIRRIFSVAGAYWLGVLFYSFLLLLALDVVRLAARVLHLWPKEIAPVLARSAGAAVLLVVAAVVLYGVWNARQPRITGYELQLGKKAGSLESLNIIVAADIHLGTLTRSGYVEDFVNGVNQQTPDIVFLVGDIVEKLEPRIEEEIAAYFPLIQSKYGTYAVLGNHEYIDGHPEEISRHLSAAGVKVLRDETVRIGDEFYLIGRDDLANARSGSVKDLAALMPTAQNENEQNLPVIVLDHQPSRLNEAAALGADLQFSGHTHHGQLFPIQYLTRRIFENDYGYLQKGDLHSIVTSGYGTWGPPLRVGNHPELVRVILRF